MSQPQSPVARLPRAQIFSQTVSQSIAKLLHIEAFGGAMLLFTAIVALIWANSSYSDLYHALWHAPVALTIGSFTVGQSLHFLINDGLMTIFFLVVGMEIRREMHSGALRDVRVALLPIMAAIGGVVVPALIYVAFNPGAPGLQGWAVPTATDIAFAVGLLALLGKSIPANIRVFLLTLAIIDDVIAVLIIAFFYSGGLAYGGLVVAAAGIALALLMQRMGIGSALAYVLPGAVVWGGLLMTGAHPTLAGVVLGLLTPVRSIPSLQAPSEMLHTAANQIRQLVGSQAGAAALNAPLQKAFFASREMVAPVERVPAILHPWVTFGIMPIFALANAGVSLGGLDLAVGGAQAVTVGVVVALVLGKPLGVLLVSWLAVRAGVCQFPPGVTWGGIILVGLLAGVGFTMSIFISMLAFTDPNLLGAAKLGVLLGSLVSAVAGLAWGVWYLKQRRTASL